MVTTQKQLRADFWAANPQFSRKGNAKQNCYPCDVRMAWCDFVEAASRNGEISEKLADRATL